MKKRIQENMDQLDSFGSTPQSIGAGVPSRSGRFWYQGENWGGHVSLVGSLAAKSTKDEIRSFCSSKVVINVADSPRQIPTNSRYPQAYRSISKFTGLAVGVSPDYSLYNFVRIESYVHASSYQPTHMPCILSRILFSEAYFLPWRIHS